MCNKRHVHADLIHAYAEGAEIQYFYNDEWRTIKNPQWCDTTEYRIKPKEPEWYENIPPHGVLCWVKDDEGHDRAITVIVKYDPEAAHCRFISFRGNTWRHADPLTDDEIKLFLGGR